MSTHTLLDYGLNFNLSVESKSTLSAVLAHFADRAAQIRRGVLGSPRGRTASDEPVWIQAYSDPVARELADGWYLVHENLNSASNMPVNKFATREFGTTLYGAVFLIRLSAEPLARLSGDGSRAQYRMRLMEIREGPNKEAYILMRASIEQCEWRRFKELMAGATV